MKTLLIALLLLPYAMQAQIITTIAGDGYRACTGAVCYTCYSGDGGAATVAELNSPCRTVFDRAGNLYIVDGSNHRIRMVSTSGIITTFAGTGTPGFTGDGGSATAAELKTPSDVAVDTLGNVYIVDEGNARVRKVNTSGIISTLADFGTGEMSGIGIDKLGNLYVACQNFNYVDKISPAGTVNFFAGNSLTGGFSGDGGPATAADLNQPSGIAVDTSGNIYIADMGNVRIRKINTSGIISTVAGNGSPSCPYGGVATASSLAQPIGVAVDNTGNIYIASASCPVIYKVNTSGVIADVAGIIGLSGYSGDGGPATDAALCMPYGVTLDGAGNYYISDVGDNVIRRVSAGVSAITGSDSVCIGAMITLADSTSGGKWHSSNPAVAAVDSLSGIVTGVSAGTVIITYGGTVVTPETVYPCTTTGIKNSSIPAPSVFNIYPNPNNGFFSLKIATPCTGDIPVIITNILGEKVKEFSLSGNKETDVQLQAPRGIYFLSAVTMNEYIAAKMVIE